MSIGYANDSKVHKSFALPKESKEIQGEFYVKGGTLPPKTFIILGKDIFSAIINKDAVSNLTVNNYQIEKSFPLIFYKNGELKCGILASDFNLYGIVLKKGTPIILDNTGKPNFKNLGIEGFRKQEWVSAYDIYNEMGSEASFDRDCVHNVVEIKNPVKLMGITWGRRTTIEFTDQHPSGLIYPRKIFARSLQEIDGQTLKKDSTVLFCWRKKDDQVVIKSIRTSTFDEFNMEDDGGNQCPW